MNDPVASPRPAALDDLGRPLGEQIEARDRGTWLAAMIFGASALLFVGGAMAHRPTIALVSLFATKEEPVAPVVVEKPATTERPARNEERRNGRQQSRNRNGR